MIDWHARQTATIWTIIFHVTWCYVNHGNSWDTNLGRVYCWIWCYQPAYLLAPGLNVIPRTNIPLKWYLVYWLCQVGNSQYFMRQKTGLLECVMAILCRHNWECWKSVYLPSTSLVAHLSFLAHLRICTVVLYTMSLLCVRLSICSFGCDVRKNQIRKKSYLREYNYGWGTPRAMHTHNRKSKLWHVGSHQRQVASVSTVTFWIESRFAFLLFLGIQIGLMDGFWHLTSS